MIRGNLIVVPLDDALIYLQPSTSSRRGLRSRSSAGSWSPAATGRGPICCPRHGGCSSPPRPATCHRRPARHRDRPTPRPSPGPSATPGPTPGTTLPADVPCLIDFANAHFELAQTALRDGDFACYGTEIALVEAALQRLEQLALGLDCPAPVVVDQPGPVTRERRSPRRCSSRWRRRRRARPRRLPRPWRDRARDASGRRPADAGRARERPRAGDHPGSPSAPSRRGSSAGRRPWPWRSSW